MRPEEKEDIKEPVKFQVCDLAFEFVCSQEGCPGLPFEGSSTGA